MVAGRWEATCLPAIMGAGMSSAAQQRMKRAAAREAREAARKVLGLTTEQLLQHVKQLRAISRASKPRPIRRHADGKAEAMRIATNARARLEAMGVSKTELAKAVGASRQAVSERFNADWIGPGRLQWLAVALLCPEEALRASTPDAARLAWRPGVPPEVWLQVVGKIIREGKPFPTFEGARTRFLAEVSTASAP